VPQLPVFLVAAVQAIFVHFPNFDRMAHARTPRTSEGGWEFRFRDPHFDSILLPLAVQATPYIPRPEGSGFTALFGKPEQYFSHSLEESRVVIAIKAERSLVMRNVIYAINVSLDGFIEDKDGNIGWSDPTEELHRYFNDLELEIDVHLYGRRMYEIMAGYWPTADANTSAPEYETEYWRRWKQVANVVFSRTLEQVSEPDRLVRDNVAEEIRRLKAQPGKAMVVGGAGLAASLMQLDLVDEVRLAVHPVILGGGKPMFPSSDQMLRLRLIETRQFKGGVVLLRYQRLEPQV
jgi:dihydrofolate reductase